jgi:glycosyltransferase involved in cell wall biosynthesis
MMIGPSVVPVSVVVPCYRCSLTIARAVDSVFAQSVIPFEVILVEDCSADETLAVLQKVEQSYFGRIKIVQMGLNLGVASARNAGWALATQPYIALLDADDSWYPEKLRIQYEYMSNNPDVTLCGHQCVLMSDSYETPDLSENSHVTKISAGSLLFKNAFSTPTVMLKRDIPFRFKEGRRCAEDLLLWQLIAFEGLQVVRIESPLAYVHKPLYGAGGLSAHLWNMEKGELSNFEFLYRTKKIGIVLFIISVSFSITKFLRRFGIVALKFCTRIFTKGGVI